MVMLRPKGKAYQIAKSVLEKKGVKVRKPSANKPIQLASPYLQH